MTRGSGRPEPGKWDIRRLPGDEGADATAAWTETYAARILGLAFTAHEDFWVHVDAVRAGTPAEEIARRYVRRDQGRRVELIAAYLKRAAAEPTRSWAKCAVWNMATRAWTVGTERPSDPRAPKRALRDDAADSMARAAVRVVRRGLGRCADLDCCDGVGAHLASDSSSDYCGSCRPRQPHPRSDVEGERVLFDRAVFAVLRADDSRPRRRAA